MADELDKLASDLLRNAQEVAIGYLGEKIKKQNIVNYNGANLAYNHGRDVANKLGLGANSIAPFPGNSSVTITNEPPQSSALKWLLPLIAGAALGGGGVGAGLLLNQPEEKPPPVVEQPAPVDTSGNVGIEIE